MKVRVLGSIEDLTIEEWGDAGYKSLPDKVSSCSGQVIIIKDSLSNTSMVVNWKGRKLRRIVNRSTATEVLSVSETISEVIFVKAILKKMSWEDYAQVPIKIFTDSKNVSKDLSNAGIMDDPRFRSI